MSKRKKIALIFIFVIIYHTNSQLPPPPMAPPPPPGLPIDAGVIFLLLSGLIYGVKKIKNN
jgi:hypothetical protein